eukprot:6205201-Pleurochrysis_carterae.AAC.4
MRADDSILGDVRKTSVNQRRASHHVLDRSTSIELGSEQSSRRRLTSHGSAGMPLICGACAAPVKDSMGAPPHLRYRPFLRVPHMNETPLRAKKRC